MLQRREFMRMAGRVAGGFCLCSGWGGFAAGLGRAWAAEGPEYYLKNQEKLMDMAQGFAEQAAQIMAQSRGPELSAKVRQETVARFRKTLPGLPFIGGDKNHLTWNLTGAAVGLAFYLTAKEHGLSLDQAGRIQFAIVEAYFKKNPRRQPPPQRTAQEIARQRQAIKDFADWTQKREYAGNWVSVFVEGQAGKFDFGADDFECGIIKLYRQYDAFEYARYQCLLDLLTYKDRGLGLVRTKTLAGGGDRCDFRYTVGGPVRLLEPFSAARLKQWGKLGE